MTDIKAAEPMAYAVMHKTAEHDYQIFGDKDEAEQFCRDRNELLEEGEPDLKPVPLYRLAERPADGEEGIYVAWMLAVGFVEDLGQYEITGESGGVVRIDRHGWSIGYRTGANTSFILCPVQPKTRQDVRDLCRVLGVALKEGA